MIIGGGACGEHVTEGQAGVQGTCDCHLPSHLVTCAASIMPPG